MPDQDQPKKASFPFKTLIWAILALVALFLFKPELKSLLSSAEEVSLFGMEFKVGKEKAAKLEIAIQRYKSEIDDFNVQMDEQQKHIAKLEEIKTNLENSITDCPGTQEDARKLNMELGIIMRTNKALQQKSDVLKNTKILQRSTGSLQMPK
ncbi:hypothetical protein [Spongiivirga citrea]|uniref:Uncharacterized protein n=1 Tax=Spongiivirga citrea TaxID=1481457 RepID=A0A6M0CFC4_9FLAO|nr:hypothetical protein [Spongiivirga citrea]NER16545.1 hypothetical protein [Spongiivirga citrea]